MELIILDEAMLALDNDTESRVIEDTSVPICIGMGDGRRSHIGANMYAPSLQKPAPQNATPHNYIFSLHIILHNYHIHLLTKRSSRYITKQVLPYNDKLTIFGSCNNY